MDYILSGKLISVTQIIILCHCFCRFYCRYHELIDRCRILGSQLIAVILFEMDEIKGTNKKKLAFPGHLILISFSGFMRFVLSEHLAFFVLPRYACTVVLVSWFSLYSNISSDSSRNKYIHVGIFIYLLKFLGNVIIFFYH